MNRLLLSACCELRSYGILTHVSIPMIRECEGGGLADSNAQAAVLATGEDAVAGEIEAHLPVEDGGSAAVLQWQGQD